VHFAFTTQIKVRDFRWCFEDGVEKEVFEREVVEAEQGKNRYFQRKIGLMKGVLEKWRNLKVRKIMKNFKKLRELSEGFVES
jgi:hypothetical protein